MNDDAKRIVLARRAKFLAMALAATTAAGCPNGGPPPQPCLSQPQPLPPPADDAGVPPRSEG